MLAVSTSREEEMMTRQNVAVNLARQESAARKRKMKGKAEGTGEAVKRSRMRLRSDTRSFGAEDEEGEWVDEVEGTIEAPLGGAPHGKATAEEEKAQKPFRLMDLPAEVRLEIYRACLTRPYPIMLSKVPTLAPKVVTTDQEADELAQAMTASSDPSSLHSMLNISTALPATRPRPWRRAVRSLHRGPVATTGLPGSTHTPTIHAGAHRPSAQSSPTSSTSSAQDPVTPVRASRPQDADPLLVTILRTNKLVYKEARNILYGDNVFTLDLNTAQYTLAALHQRSRGQIKRIHVTIPTHNDILERFAEVVRLSFRYCWRLRQLCINMPFVIPGADGSGTNGNTTVYANAFDILRWLPKQCEVVLEGNVCEEVRSVVDKNANLAKDLDEVAYARRQLISNDNERAPRDGAWAHRC